MTQLAVGMRVQTPDGPGQVALFRQDVSHDYGKRIRRASVVVELDDGGRKVFLPHEITREDER